MCPVCDRFDYVLEAVELNRLEIGLSSCRQDASGHVQYGERSSLNERNYCGLYSLLSDLTFFSTQDKVTSKK
jgi:hypothetical protein